MRTVFVVLRMWRVIPWCTISRYCGAMS